MPNCAWIIETWFARADFFDSMDAGENDHENYCDNTKVKICCCLPGALTQTHRMIRKSLAVHSKL